MNCRTGAPGSRLPCQASFIHLPRLPPLGGWYCAAEDSDIVKALLLLAHGSRDPLWPKAVEAVAQNVQASMAAGTVLCAYIEHTQPNFADAVASMFAAGHRRIEVLPVFIGAGRHVREDVQSLVQQALAQHPGLVLAVRPFLGDDPRFTDLVARMALDTLA